NAAIADRARENSNRLVAEFNEQRGMAKELLDPLGIRVKTIPSLNSLPSEALQFMRATDEATEIVSSIMSDSKDEEFRLADAYVHSGVALTGRGYHDQAAKKYTLTIQALEQMPAPLTAEGEFKQKL